MISERLVINPRREGYKARQIRREGYVPGVVYGSGRDTTPIEVDGKSLSRLIRKIGQSVLFEIAMEDGVDAVRIRELQRDPVTREIIHVDMERVEANEIVQAEVPLKFEGIKNAGTRGIAIQYQKDKVKIEGYAKDIPSFIRVEIKDIKPGQAFHVYDLEVADELTVIDDMNELIYTAVRSKEDEDEKEQPLSVQEKEPEDNREDVQKEAE